MLVNSYLNTLFIFMISQTRTDDDDGVGPFRRENRVNIYKTNKMHVQASLNESWSN